MLVQIPEQLSRWSGGVILPASFRRIAAVVAGACAAFSGLAAESPDAPAIQTRGIETRRLTRELETKRTTVRRLACDAGIPPDFALAVLDKESGFDNTMRGSMGEIGASQILPATAFALGLDVRRLAVEFAYNAKAGVAILQSLLAKAQGDQVKALCHYRAGPRWFRLPPRAQRRVRAYASAVVEIMKTRYAGVSCP